MNHFLLWLDAHLALFVFCVFMLCVAVPVLWVIWVYGKAHDEASRSHDYDDCD